MDADWFKARMGESPYPTVTELSARAGIERTILSKIISGSRPIQLTEARTLADLLGVPMGELIRRAGVPFGRKDNV